MTAGLFLFNQLEVKHGKSVAWLILAVLCCPHDLQRGYFLHHQQIRQPVPCYDSLTPPCFAVNDQNMSVEWCLCDVPHGTRGRYQSIVKLDCIQVLIGLLQVIDIHIGINRLSITCLAGSRVCWPPLPEPKGSSILFALLQLTLSAADCHKLVGAQSPT